MKKTSIILLVIGAALIWGLYQLPKGNVSNRSQDAPAGANRDAAMAQPKAKEEDMDHVKAFSPEQQAEINRLKATFLEAKDLGSAQTRFQPLLKAFTALDRLDSAAHYAEQLAQRFPNRSTWNATATLYLEAQTYALNPEKAQSLGTKARNYFEKILAEEPENLTVKTSLAMTYVDSPTPMKGIGLLREVIAAEPTFIPALFNLGILSIKSNQFAKAQERFTQILKLDPKHYKAALNLGFCLAQLEKHAEAEKVLNMVLKESKDPAETKAAADLLKELKEHGDWKSISTSM